MIKGIDVSEHNGVINWDRVVDSDVKFAIIRIGIGNDMPDQDDEQAIANMKACVARGIPFGVYLYSYALKLSDVESEAAHAIRMLKGFNPTLGVWFDMEDADQYKAHHGINVYQSKAMLTEFCVLFMKKLIAAGYKNVGVYANYDYFKNVLDLNQIKAVGKIWLAHWGISKPSMPCEIWQYADDGIVPGIRSRVVDMNYYCGSAFPEKEKPEPEVEVSPSVSPKTTAKYKVQRGDTLTKIANLHKSTVAELVALNRLTNPNLIRTGQVLTVPAVYVVQAGDNLTKIANQHMTMVEKLAAVNKGTIANIHIIKIGQVVNLA